MSGVGLKPFGSAEARTAPSAAASSGVARKRGTIRMTTPRLRSTTAVGPNDHSARGRLLAAGDEVLEVAGPLRRAELAQRLRLDLADALAGDREPLPHLLERVVRLLPDAEAQPQDLLLTWREGGEDFPRLFFEGERHRGVGRRERLPVLHEIAERALFVVADRRLEGDG